MRDPSFDRLRSMFTMRKHSERIDSRFRTVRYPEIGRRYWFGRIGRLHLQFCWIDR